MTCPCPSQEKLREVDEALAYESMVWQQRGLDASERDDLCSCSAWLQTRCGNKVGFVLAVHKLVGKLKLIALRVGVCRCQDGPVQFLSLIVTNSGC